MNALYDRIINNEDVSVLIENLTDIITILDTNGQIKFINHASQHVLGYHPKDMIGQIFTKYIAPGDLRLAGEEFARSLQSPYQTMTSEIRALTSEYTIRILQSRTSYIPQTTEDKISGLFVTSRDITNERNHESALFAAQKRIVKSLNQTVSAIASTVGARDTYTASHQIRVADLAVAIGRKMGFDRQKLEGLRLAATIHDVGKVQIPTEILTKPMGLSEVEYALVKTHAEAGYNILKDIDFPWPIAEIVYQHHEQVDGTGYPRGLKADEILIEAKILAVADTIEAMSNDRPYRKSPGLEAALDEIRRKRGISYEGKVVDTCLSLFKKENYRFPDV